MHRLKIISLGFFFSVWMLVILSVNSFIDENVSPWQSKSWPSSVPSQIITSEKALQCWWDSFDIIHDCNPSNFCKIHIFKKTSWKHINCLPLTHMLFWSVRVSCRGGSRILCWGEWQPSTKNLQNSPQCGIKIKNNLDTRTHSNRMHTVQCSNHLPGEEGCLPKGGVSVQRKCLPGGISV